MSTPSTAPLNTTSGSSTGTPTPQAWDIGAQAYSATTGSDAVMLVGSATPTTTSFNVPLNPIQSQNSLLFDAVMATVAIVNNTNVTLYMGSNGTAATSFAQLQFYDTIGGQQVTIPYALPDGGVGIPAGKSQTYFIALGQGLLKNLQLAINSTNTPTSGTVSVQVILHRNLRSGPVSGTIFPNATYATAPAPVLMFTPPGMRGVIISNQYSNGSDVSPAGISFEIDYIDPFVQGSKGLTSFSIGSGGFNIWGVYPGGIGGANGSLNAPLPSVWQAKITHKDGQPYTYYFNYQYVP